MSISTSLLNDGKGQWVLSPGWFIPLIDNGGFTESDGTGDNGLRLADINGDGYPDIVQADGKDQRIVLLNDRVSDWTASTLHEIPEIAEAGFTEAGDGDSGRCQARAWWISFRGTRQGGLPKRRGSGQTTGACVDNAGFTEDGGDGDNALRFADLNFDGFTDLIQADGKDQRDVYLNNGSNGWIKVRSWQIPMITLGGFTEDGGEGDNGLNISDVNGDGFPDLIQGDGLEERRTYLNAMTHPPLLNRIDNGIGGIIEAAYQTHPGKPITYTVSGIRESDGFNSNLSR
ncbi:MAG: hypothetical protein IPG32_04895 [Saprospirales bacterium]|nr:hypothetical protein [Saprospirales bacterium]